MMMRLRLRRASVWQPAITDVYDEQRGTLLVQYPVWLILVLVLGGVTAFALTGFVDGPPLVIFLWLCALVIALQVSIFRHASMRGRLIATLVVTGLAVLGVAFVKFGNVLPDALTHPAGPSGGQSGSSPAGPSLATSLASNPWTYVVANFGLLAIFWVDTLRRWVRRARGLPPTSRVALTPDEARQDAARLAQTMPSLEELISGDLIAGFVLAAALAFVFQANVLQTFIHNVSIDTCTLALPAPLASCTSGTDAAAMPTLTFLDRIQALIYLPLGLIILGLTATLSGLGAAGGVDAASARPAVQRATMTGKSASRSSAAIAEDVTTTVVKTLRSAVDRRIRHLVRNLALSLRTVAWPALIVLAIFGLSEVAIDLQLYLASDKSPLKALTLMGPGVAWGVGAALAITFAAALFVFRVRVADNTLRFLGLIGFVVLLVFWIFSAALAVVNVALKYYMNVTNRQPFWPLGLTTYISLAALVIWGALALLRRSRSSGQATDEAGELIGAGREAPGGGD